MAKVNRQQLLEKAMAAVEDDELIGFCIACGEQADEVKPDAEKYKCEACGKFKVYGAKQLVMILSFDEFS